MYLNIRGTDTWELPEDLQNETQPETQPNDSRLSRYLQSLGGWFGLAQNEEETSEEE